MERAGHSRHGLNHARHERRLHLRHRVVDRDAEALVEDLDAEDLGRAHRAVFVGSAESDVEGQHLVGVPGGRNLCVLAGGGDLVVQAVDRRADRGTGRTNHAGLEHATALADLRVLGTDLVHVGDEGASTLLDEVQESVAIEVDPDQRSGDAALVARVCASVGAAHRVHGRLLTGDRVVDGLGL